MQPDQALQVLAQVAAEFRGTRKDHEMIEQALRTISTLIPKPAEKTE
jgi:hypothetical protein